MSCNSGPFNDDAATKEDVFRLIKEYDIKNFIETGTFLGLTTELVATQVEKVITFEIDKNTYEKASNRLSRIPNVQRFLGPSQTLLPQFLASNQLEGRIMFYLDAHWGDPNPLRLELEIISKSLPDNCIIAIDDCFVPGRNYGCDPFEGNTNISYDVLRPLIEKVFPKGHTYYFLNRARPNRPGRPSGKLYVLPAAWGDHSHLYITQNGINYSSTSV